MSLDFQSLDDLSGLSTMDSIGFSRALPKEASGNDLPWAYAMKNDLLGKKISNLDSQDDSPPFYQLQHEEHALAYG